MKKHSLLLLVAVTILISSNAQALPRFALLRGEANCLRCHVNPTGGQMRSEEGQSFAINDLAMWKRGDKYSGQISDGLRIGGDFRDQFLYFSQKSPLYGFTQSDSNIQKLTKRGDTTSRTTSFHAMSLALEIDFQATKTLSGFFRYDPLNTNNPSEGWAMLHFVHSSGELIQSGDVVTNAYVKFGAFLPAFGIRFDDHTVYVRGGTASLSSFVPAGFFWTPGYRDVGVEFGTTLFDHINIIAGAFNGQESSIKTQNFSTDPSNNKAFCFSITSSGEIIEDMLAGEIGVSRYMHNHSDQNNLPANLVLTGLHFSLRAGPVTILNEYDFGENVAVSGHRNSSSTPVVPKASGLCSEAAIRISKGFDALFRYENFKEVNASGATTNQVESRIMIGAQWFPLRFLEVRPEFRIAMTSSPNLDDKTFTNDFTENTFLLQTHVFF